jgi:hypothetical protein|tara:strand:- start:134 stop:355 length:222 start_codon:yes stop_codon:yes gene_type:complete
MSAYALRDTHVEFQDFEAGTYLMYVEVQWNGKTPNTTFCVNCYGPSEVIWQGDKSTLVNQEKAGLASGIYNYE